ncbi:nuclear transport factor 2 family protein [Xenophilus arseniciresistens]|uniref:Nuclear transport factor 2 family protein n=1 Tax=Xenophilus arseniciresistens TaxID=1283306 RepID=A0AAE3N823_9BURK|nr:nuclear transport factor 2 family protein [Xenophilus arseniciresistens]MDA7416293.1 nuclear transport factor 2 family protein [Xenophilus arseniciresistens]
MNTAPTLDTWIAKLACRELIETSVQHVDDGNASAFAALFAPDAVLVRPNGSLLEGRAAIEAAYAQRPATRLTRHLVSNVVVTLTDDTHAHARSYVLLWSSDLTEADPVYGRRADARQLVGEFEDQLSRGADGQWQLQRRAARFVLQHPG